MVSFKNILLALGILLLALKPGCGAAFEADKNNQGDRGPTVFDAGIDRNGFKTYVIHGFQKVEIANTQSRATRFTKSFQPSFHTEGLGLLLDVVQASVALAGASQESAQGSIRIESVNAATVDRTKNSKQPISITVGGTMTGKVAIEDLQYTIYVSTTEKAPQAQAISDLQTALKQLQDAVDMIPSNTQGQIRSVARTFPGFCHGTIILSDGINCIHDGDQRRVKFDFSTCWLPNPVVDVKVNAHVTTAPDAVGIKNWTADRESMNITIAVVGFHGSSQVCLPSSIDYTAVPAGTWPPT